MRREDTVRFLARIPDSMLWNPGRPTQYTLRVKTQHEGRYMEYIELPLGFRTVELRNGQAGGKRQSRRTPHARGSAPVPGRRR